jgi:TetR/AcrR family transcriptional regulator, cholesterol catabolism regulator
VRVARTRDDEKWDEIRTDIVDNSARLFARQGYHGTGVSELGDAVGLGRGHLYYYIGSKEKLLGLIHSRVMAYVLASAERAVAHEGSAADRLEILGRDLIKIITDYPDHVWVFLHEFRALTGEEAASFRAQRHRYESAVRTILEDGVAAGEFEVPDVGLASLAWLGLHNYIYIWFDSEGQHSPREISDYFASIFLNGIRPRKARPKTARPDTARRADKTRAKP